MPRATPIQTSFNAGEFAPELDGRVDIAKYASACRRLENFIPLTQGPARRRGGTKFVAEVRDSSARTWLERFEFNATQAYVLEFGHEYVRFFTNNGALLNTAQSVLVISQTNPGILTYGGDDPANGDWYYLADINGMTPLSGRTVKVANVDTVAKTFELNEIDGTPINTYTYPGYTGGGTLAKVVTVTTPYTSANLINADGSFALQSRQTGDVIYIAHPAHAPRKLSRISATEWTLTEMENTGGPFEDVDPDETVTVYASAATGAGVTLEASSSIFAASDVGRLFYLEGKKANAIQPWESGKAITSNNARRSDGRNYLSLNSATTGTVRPTHSIGAEFDGDTGIQWEFLDTGYGWVEITGYTDSEHVTCTVLSRLPEQVVLIVNATTRWAFGAWGSVPGYPSHVGLFRDRLVFARSTDRVMWFSVAGDYESFADRDDAGEVVKDMSLTLTIQGEQANGIQWLSASDVLIVGTASGEFLVRELTNAESFGPGNATVVSSSEYGARGVAPARVGDSVVFVQRSGRRLREIQYDALQDAYKAADLSVFSPHLVPKNRYIRQLAYQKEPYSIVWSLRDDGLLLGMTLNRDQEVTGWHRHPIGGNGIVESITVVPAPDNNRDDLWMIVQRTINGVTKRYIERMVAEYESGDEQADAFYVDCGLSYTGTAAAVISGLGHLEGATVAVLAAGATHPTRVVTNGLITLARSATPVHIGFSAPAKLATMRRNEGSEGTAQGKIKRIVKVIVRLLDTLGGRMGPSETENDLILFRSASHAMGSPPPIFTGDKILQWPGTYETDGYIWYVQDEPLPVTVVAIMPELTTAG